MNFKLGEIVETEKFQQVLKNVLKIILKKKKYFMFAVFLQKNLDFVLLEIHMKDFYRV